MSQPTPRKLAPPPVAAVPDDAASEQREAVAGPGHGKASLPSTNPARRTLPDSDRSPPAEDPAPQPPQKWQMRRHTVDELLARLETQRQERFRADEAASGPMQKQYALTDFAIEEQLERRRDRMSIPSSWQSPVLPQPRSWAAQQMRSGALGLALGLTVLVPGALWLKHHRPQGRVTTPASQTASSLPARATPAMPTPVESAQPPMLLSPPQPAMRPETATRSEPPVVEQQPDPAVAAPVAPAARETEPPGAVASLPPAVEPTVPTLAPPETAATPEPAPQETASASRPAAPTEPTPDELLADIQKQIDGGDVIGARKALQQSALEKVAQAHFMLAETFDPNVLAAWGTRGVESETERAIQLYEQALRGGIAAAAKRIDALKVR